MTQSIDHMKPTPQIYARILGVMKDIGVIGKNNTNEHQHYQFRGIDDVYNAMQPALIANEVFLAPVVLNATHEMVQTSGGKPTNKTVLTVRYKFYTTDGSYIEADAVGESLDTSDKATNKALSNAFKYVCFQVFCIPTREFIDAERDDFQLDNQSGGAAPRYNAPPPPPAPGKARSDADICSGAQLGKIRALGREKNIDVDAAIQKEFGCQVDELSKSTASSVIDRLEKAAIQETAPVVPPPPAEPPPAAAPPPEPVAPDLPPASNVAEFPSHTGTTTPPPAKASSKSTKASLVSQRTAITNLCNRHGLDLANEVNIATAGRTNDIASIQFEEAADAIRRLSKM